MINTDNLEKILLELNRELRKLKNNESVIIGNSIFNNLVLSNKTNIN